MTTRVDVSSPLPAGEFGAQKQGEGQLQDANSALMELEKGELNLKNNQIKKKR